jgi:hypothetical protein
LGRDRKNLEQGKNERKGGTTKAHWLALFAVEER